MHEFSGMKGEAQRVNILLLISNLSVIDLFNKKIIQRHIEEFLEAWTMDKIRK